MRTNPATFAAVGLLALLTGCSSGAAGTPSPTPIADPTACGPASATGNYPGWEGPDTSSPDAVIPYVVSQEVTIGPNRFLFTLIDKQNQLLAAPDVTTDLRFFALARDPATAATSGAGTYLDSGTGRGLYRTSVDFSCSGDWGIEVVVHRPSGDATARAGFSVRASGTTPAIGAAAPRSDSPTASTPAEIAAISTDLTPDPDFYRLSIAGAVTSGKPSLIVFATPAFCQTRTCGPALDMVQSVAGGYKGAVDFVHVEPYVLQMTPNGLQPVFSAKGQPQPVQSVNDYGLATEPYLFLVGDDGNVVAKFEGIAGADELRAALDGVTGG